DTPPSERGNFRRPPQVPKLWGQETQPAPKASAAPEPMPAATMIAAAVPAPAGPSHQTTPRSSGRGPWLGPGSQRSGASEAAPYSAASETMVIKPNVVLSPDDRATQKWSGRAAPAPVYAESATSSRSGVSQDPGSPSQPSLVDPKLIAELCRLLNAPETPPSDRDHLRRPLPRSWHEEKPASARPAEVSKQLPARGKAPSEAPSGPSQPNTARCHNAYLISEEAAAASASNTVLFELGLAAVRGGAQSSGPSEQCCCYRHAIPADAEADAETARQAEAEAARQAAQAAAYFQAKAAAQPQAMFGYAALQTALTVVVTMVVTWLWCYFSMGAVTQAERAHRQLRKDVLQSLTDLEKTLKDDGQTTRDSMSFQDIQARIQAAINKSMANGVTTEEMASRLESVHAGICKALRMLRRELVDEVEGFMQTLKQDLEGHGLGVSHNHRKDLLDAMDARLDKLADKVRTDINTCVSDSRTVMRDLARVYDKNNKEHRETRDVIAWIQQQCEYIEHRTDHLPAWTTTLPPPPTQQQWVPPTGGTGPTLLHLDESLPMAMNTRSILTPVTLPDGRVLCVPRTVIAQLLGGTM
ncbi:unnamed protein product, partial [Symbiodinium sp. KB8]